MVETGGDITDLSQGALNPNAPRTK